MKTPLHFCQARLDWTKENTFWLFLLFLYAILISTPLFSSHIILGHDIYFHLNRIEGIKEGLLAGQFPVRIHAFQLNGYGFPAGVFYPDLFLYLPALLRLIGIPLNIAYNSFCFLLNLTTAILSWWAFSRLTSSIRVGAVSALFYSGFFYRLANFYSRSALGEMAAMAFLPAALISLWLLLRKSPSIWPAVVLTFTAILQSHIISSLFLAGAALLQLLISWNRLKEKKVRRSLLKAAGFTLLLNLWFFIPFLTFYHSITFHIQDLTTYPLSEFSFSLPIAIMVQFFCGWPLLLVLLSLAVVRLYQHRTGAFALNSLFWWMIAIGSLTALSITTFFPWDLLQKIPLLGQKLSIMQFSFRMEEFTAIAFSLAAGIGITQLLPDRVLQNSLLFFFAVFIGVWNLHGLQGIQIPYEKYHVTVDWSINPDTFTAAERANILSRPESLYLDYTYKDISFRDNQDAIRQLPADKTESAAAQITDFHRAGNRLTFTSRSEGPSDIRLPLFYYPGYEAYTGSGQKLSLFPGEAHRLMVQAPAGENLITVKYSGTTIFQLADMISLFSIFAFLFAACDHLSLPSKIFFWKRSV